MYRFALGIACAALIGGCAIGSPPGFSSGSKWSFPLVSPLENTPLLVPVKINGKGPYLFVIDPDSPVSSLDSGIQSTLKLYTTRGPKLPDERDVRVNTSLAEVRTLSLGTLTVSNRKLRVVQARRYYINGRLVRGVIGRDVIADSLIFAYNRDTGMGYIATQGNMLPWSNATVLKYRRFNNKKLIVTRLNNKHKVELHLDLGGPMSMLWPSKIKKFRLPQLRAEAQVMDELGTLHTIRDGTLIGTTEVKGLKIHGMHMLAYNDKRMNEVDIDGTLGQNFFGRYNITANWHKTEFHLQPRAKDVGIGAKDRMRRWGPGFDKCKHTACVQIEVIPANRKPPGATPPTTTPPGKTPPVETKPTPTKDNHKKHDAKKDPSKKHPPKKHPLKPTAKPSSSAPVAPPTVYNLRVSREAMALADYEILIEAVDKNGKSLGLPWLTVTLPKDVPVIQEPRIQRGYEKAASFRVLDLSPFPRKCQIAGTRRRCVWPLRKAH